MHITAAWEDAFQLTVTVTTCSTNMKLRPSKGNPATNTVTVIPLPAKATASATALSAIDAQPNAHPMTNAQMSAAAVITIYADQMAVVPQINLYRYGTFQQMMRI